MTAPDFDSIINPSSPAPPQPHGRRRRGARNTVRHVSVGAHILELCTGVIYLLLIICLMQLGWMYGGRSLDSIHTQEMSAKTVGFNDKTAKTTTDRIAQPQTGDAPVDGQPADKQFVGWMYIPRLGDDWKRAIQQGTETTVLDNMGLGHYPQTVMPGGNGNTSYAGHRAPGDLGYADRLETGDAIVIQTNDHWYVYQVTDSWLTTKEHTEVLNSEESKQWLTLTTCDPLFATETTPDRLIIRARFAYWANTTDGLPKELAKDTGTPAKAARAKVSQTIRDVSKSVPVSRALFAVAGGFWLLFAGICWLVWRGDRERRTPSWNVLVLSWHVQCGPVVLRALAFLFLWSALLFAEWAWLAPSFARWLDVLQPWWDSLGLF